MLYKASQTDTVSAHGVLTVKGRMEEADKRHRHNLGLGLEGEDKQMGTYFTYFHFIGKERKGVFCNEGNCGSCLLRLELEAISLLVGLFISEHM